MKFTLKIWRQANNTAQGKMVDYAIDNINENMSFLEMIDELNESLILKGDEPVAFDSIAVREYVACVVCTLMGVHMGR